MEKWRSHVSQEYRRFRDYPQGNFQVGQGLVAKVTTVIKLSPEDEEGLRQALEELTGKEVNIVNKIDPGIIAGMVISTADIVIDLSMASRLQKLSSSIHQRITEEFQQANDMEKRVISGDGA